MKEYNTIRAIKNKNVLEVTLNRPNLHNAFNEEVISELVDCFTIVNNEKSIRLITLKGEGKSFCAGADLNWMKKMKDYSEEDNFKDSKELASLFDTINNCSLPVVAFIHGAILGGGCGLISVCDYVLCKEGSKFGFTETRLGLLPAVISPFVIAKIGESYARAYFPSGAKFTEDQALNMGLVHEVATDISWEESKKRVTNSFLKSAPDAAKESKVLIKNVLSLNTKEEVLNYTSKTIAKIRIGNEAQEGMNSLLEKRLPNWMTE